MTTDPPQITIQSPFDHMELPALFCWAERIKASVWDDTIPADLDNWMDYQLERLASQEIATFGLYKDGRLGGYFEAVTSVGGDGQSLDDALKYIAQAQAIFKKEMWGVRYTRPAVNLALAEVYKSGIETVFFPVLAHNRPLRELFWKVGARSMGMVSPRMQQGNPVDTEMYALTATEWQKENGTLVVESVEEKSTHEIEPVMAGD